jgi:hypothetical protein
MNRDEKTDAQFRDTDVLLDMPSTQGMSHARTQSELLQETQWPGKRVFRKAKDYLKIQVALWVWHYVKSRLGGKYPFAFYKSGDEDQGVYPLSPAVVGDASPAAVKVSLTGDWASGTADADAVGRAMADGDPQFTIHLGDIYYVGTKKEIVENMLGGKTLWPLGSRGSFSLNANHEMYARGKAYFKHLLPALGLRDATSGTQQGQGASYFCLKSDDWLVVGLDTGYNSVGIPVLEKIFKPSCKLEKKLMAWLREEVRIHEDRRRGVVLLSHHQYYSQFESYFDRPAAQLSRLIDRPVLWFWGHEHRLAIYGKHATRKGKLQAYGRCVGHGGLPIEDIRDIPKEDDKHQVGLVFYDKRSQKEIGYSETPVGFNGYADLVFQGNRLTVDYRDAGATLLREVWEVGTAGNLRGVSIEQLVQGEGLVIHPGASLEDAQR